VEEKSTANSPPKDNPEENQQDSPRIEVNDQVNEGSKKGNETIVKHGPVEHGPVVKDQPLDAEKQHQPQVQNPNNTEEPSNQKSPSVDPEDMGHYFESSNEENISAEPGGSSIDPQSSTSKISAAAGIPESLIQGLNVSTLEEALEKLLSEGSFNTNSEGTSAPTQNDEAARLEQAHL
jgi:hypothetical protein